MLLQIHYLMASCALSSQPVHKASRLLTGKGPPAQPSPQGPFSLQHSSTPRGWDRVGVGPSSVFQWILKNSKTTESLVFRDG